MRTPKTSACNLGYHHPVLINHDCRIMYTTSDNLEHTVYNLQHVIHWH